MSSEWETLFQIGIYLSGGLFLFTILSMWARSVKRYWLAEMNRETKREWEENGDANGQ